MNRIGVKSSREMLWLRARKRRPKTEMRKGTAEPPKTKRRPAHSNNGKRGRARDSGWLPRMMASIRI
jgi:hypothetical protein